MSTVGGGEPPTPDPPSQVYKPGLVNSTTIIVSWKAKNQVCSQYNRYSYIEVDGEETRLPFLYNCENEFYVTDLLPGSARRFRVRLANQVGSSNWSDYVNFSTAATEPGKPYDPPVLRSLNLSMVVLALPLPISNGLPIERLEIESLASGQVVGTDYVDTNSISDEVIAILPRGTENASVTYRYRAYNSKGWGDFSDPLIAAQTVTFEPAAPARPLLVENSTTPRSFNISFTLPTTSATPLAGQFYPIERMEIQVKPADGLMVVYQLYEADIAASCPASAIPCSTPISGLKPATTYTIVLAAFSEGGGSTPGPALTVSTPPDVPSPVTDVQVTVEGEEPGEQSTALHVQWSPSVDSNGGSLGGYRVWVCDVQSGACTYNETAASVISTTVAPLEAGRNFTVDVAAFSSVGQSANVTAGKAYTTYSTPLAPGMPYLGDELAGLSNTTTIHARWNVPFSNGLEILRYNLLVDGRFEEQASTSFPQHISVGLIPGTPHNLSVQAVNSKGSSLWSETAFFETAPSVPGGADQYFSARR